MNMTSATLPLIDKLWTASLPALRVIDPFEFRPYLLAVFFLKALNELARLSPTEIPTQDHVLVWAETKIVIPPAAHFSVVVQPGTDPAARLHAAFQALATANPERFSQWFAPLDFRDTGPLGKLADPPEFLRQWLSVFQQENLTREMNAISSSPLGGLYDALLVRLAHECGSRGTTFYVPPELTHLVAMLLAPAAGTTVFAPDCDTGSFFLPLARPTPSEKIQFVGTQSHAASWALGQMRLFLYGQLQARVYCPPLHSDFALPAPFDFIIANPFFSSANWNIARPEAVRFVQSQRGKVPRRNMGFQFLQGLAQQLKETGKMAALLPLGALFWGHQELEARQAIVELNWLEAVIAFPSHLFLGSPYAFALVLLNRAKPTDDILFIDATRQAEAGKDYKRRRLDQLKPTAIPTLTTLYQNFVSVEQRAVRVSLQKVRDKNYDLSLSHYFPLPTTPEVTPQSIQQEITKLERQLVEVRQELQLALAQLDIQA